MSLSAALADRGARARRAETVRAFGQAFRARPEIADCLRRLDALRGAEPGATGALAAARPLLDDDRWLRRLMTDLARAARADPLFEPPFRPIGGDRQQGLELLRHPRLILSVLLLQARGGPDQPAIGFPGRRSLVRFVRGAGAAIDLWRVQDRLARSDGGRVLSDGLVLGFDGIVETWTLRPGGADVLILQAVPRGGATTIADYDRHSGRLLGRSAGETGAMRLQLMATLVRQLGRADAAPAIAEAMADGPPHMRWHLMRELVALDHRAARPHLDHMAARDDDGDLRALATRTLALLPA